MALPDTNTEMQKLPQLNLRATFVANSIDVENRTVDCVFATDNPIFMGYWSQYYEILGFNPGEVRMSRLNAGAPVLDNHRQYGSVSDTVIGKVEKAWVENGKGYARLRFSKRPDFDGTWQDIADGILGNISVGYRVYKYEEVNSENEITTYRAIDWEPFEISVVGVPADFDATVRSSEQKSENEVLIIHLNNRKMANEQDPIKKEDPKTTPISTPTNEEINQARAAAEKAERERVIGINDAVRTANLSADFANDLISKGTDLLEARKLIMEEWAKKDPTRGISGIQVDRDESDKHRDAQIALLSMRSGQVKADQFTAESIELSKKYRNKTLLDLCRMALDKLGINHDSLDKMDLVGRAITSSQSDFPVLLEGTNRRILLAAYQAVADTWRRWCAVGTVSDFREYKRLRPGSFTKLDKVAANGEFKTKKIPDGEFEKVSAATFGNIINVTREMIVNDDLQAFTSLAAMLGRAASLSIEIDAYALLASNPVMNDTKTLFHADHGNLISSGSGAPSVAQFDAMRVLLASQKDPSNNEFIGLMADIGLFPIGLGGAARVVNGSQYDTDVSNKFQVPNKVVGLLRDIVDSPRVIGNGYYFFADPTVEPVIEVSFLDGVQLPYLESKESFNVDGMEWKIRHDYGVSAVGWRGAVKNNG